MNKSETRIFLKHYLGRRFSMPALARRFGASRRTIHERVETAQSDSDLSTGDSRYSPRSPAVAPSAVSRGRSAARPTGNLANRGKGTRLLGLATFADQDPALAGHETVRARHRFAAPI